MGQKVNPIVLRLGKTKEWNSKYYEKKSIEQSLYTFKNIEIHNFIEKFLKDNDLILNNCKLNYSNNTLHIFISYYFLEPDFLKNKILIKNQRLKRLPSRKLNNFKFYFSPRKFSNAGKLKFLRYSWDSLLGKYINIQNFKINFFTEKFIESLNHFINKKEIKIILTFKHLNKSTKLDLNCKKLKFLKKKLPELRLFEKNLFFNEGLNIFFTWVINSGSAELLAKFIANQLKFLKKNQNFFLKFIKTALTIFSNKAINSSISGIKIKIKGKFNKAARAKHRVIKIGNVPLFSMTSNINYSEKISYSPYGTFGVKIWTYKNL